MLTILTFLWGNRYAAANVNSLARQVRRHYPRPHRFLCVTNQPEGVDCETIPDREDFKDTPSPHGGQFPVCYRRLILWHPDAAQWFGERFVSLDLDMILTADVTPLWERPEDCVLLRDPLYPDQYNGSMVLLTAGARPHVWSDFRPDTSPARARAAGKRGSDQGWISYVLPNEATWGPEDGVYSYRKDIMPRRGALPPAGARMVSFHGHIKPWTCGQLWATE